jgi:hypothetical protein
MTVAYNVTYTIPNQRELLNSDVVFDAIREDQGKVGTLKVSKGGVDWRPGRGKKVYTFSWDQFHAAIVRAAESGRAENPRQK